MQEERESNIYVAPEDRMNEQQHQKREYMAPDLEEDSQERAQYTDSITPVHEQRYVPNPETQAKKRNLAAFIIFSLLSAALLGYIIYLIVCIFVSMGK